MRLRLLLPAIGAAWLAACGASTAPTPPETVLVRFGGVVGDSDVAHLLAIGGTLVRRVDPAGLVQLITPTASGPYASVPGVTQVAGYGTDPDPTISVFLTTTTPPTSDDIAFVRSLSNSSVAVTSAGSIAATVPVSALPALVGSPRIVAIRVDIVTARPS